MQLLKVGGVPAVDLGQPDQPPCFFEAKPAGVFVNGSSLTLELVFKAVGAVCLAPQ